MLEQSYFGEQWKAVVFDFEYTNEYRLEVSSFGRMRSFHKTSNGNILSGSMINGYRIIRLKFFTKRDSAMATKLADMQDEVATLAGKIKLLLQTNEAPEAIDEQAKLLAKLKKNLSKQFAADTKKRTIHYHSLVHRLVAQYFLQPPTKDQAVVAHLDHNKLNNHIRNLRWMTLPENYAHQEKSPFVIAEKIDRNNPRRKPLKSAKLTVTKVMLLKKLLNQGKPIKTLVKQFKITDTQILRIKRGENWGKIEAAV